ncbi:MAG: MATE family efflux transporter, partial [Actinomycetota bacterium]
MPRATRHDRDLARLAVPALGALAVEPLYVLVDTAIVGHLGTAQLAGLALAGTLLSTAIWLCSFLAYGTTAQVARLVGAGRRDDAQRLATQSLWLALALGAAIAAGFAVLAGPVVAVMGGDGAVADKAVTYLRVAAAGAPFALVALSGQGYLRGVQDMVTPLRILLASNVLNVILEVAFVYGLDMDVAGSALGTVIAQAAAAAAFLPRLMARRERPRLRLMRPLARIGGDLVVRTGALLLAFTVATAVLARVGPGSLGAHQVAFQLFVFLALALDAIAVACQALVGTHLGAGRAAEAVALARRATVWGLAAGVALTVTLAALAGPLPRAFTDDPAVLTRLDGIWWLFALMQPANAVVFVLDGVLIGAGDTAYLRRAMIVAVLAFLPLALAAEPLGWGLRGVWAALALLLAARLAGNV